MFTPTRRRLVAPQKSFPEDTLPRELTLQPRLLGSAQPPQAVIPGEAAASTEAVPTLQQRAAKEPTDLLPGWGRGRRWRGWC